MINEESFMRPKLHNDIKREEFDALANRKPSLEGDWVYRYEAYSIDEDGILYPKFELWKEDDRLFLTFEDAEKFMRHNEPKNSEYRFYCHYITQLPIGDDTDEIGSCWMYDANKNLIDYSITQWTAKNPENYHYLGKPSELIRFKPGEIVEVRTDLEVRLALLLHPSSDIEWCWQYLQRCKSRDSGGDLQYNLDGSDNVCYILDGPNEYFHDHVSPLRIMKTHFPVPEDINRMMKGWMKTFNDSDIHEYELVGVKEDTYKIRNYGCAVGEFYRLSIVIHYNESSEIPHLHISDEYGLNVGLRMDIPEYYDHDEFIGRLVQYRDRLSENQIKSLMNYLGKVDVCRTNWWYLLRDWNEREADDEHNIPLDLPLPDYTKLIGCN